MFAFSLFPIHFLPWKLIVSVYKKNSNECFQFIQSHGKVMFNFETGIICWFEANSFHFSICQKQFEYHYVVKYSFQGKEMFLPNCLTVFDDHYHFSNEKTRRNVNEMKKVEQIKGKTTIWWVKTWINYIFYVWKYHKNSDKQHAV